MIRPLGQEDPLEEGMAAHSSLLAWRKSVDRGAWQVIVRRVTQSQTQLKQLGTHVCKADFTQGPFTEVGFCDGRERLSSTANIRKSRNL